jgi:hypothetical protein
MARDPISISNNNTPSSLGPVAGKPTENRNRIILGIVLIAIAWALVGTGVGLHKVNAIASYCLMGTGGSLIIAGAIGLCFFRSPSIKTIESIKNKLDIKKLYTPQEEVLLSFWLGPSQGNSKAAKIARLSHEDFISLPLQDIDDFSSQEFEVVQHRLHILDERKVSILLKLEKSLTLNSLRGMDPSTILTQGLSERSLGLLSIWQVKAILNKTPTSEQTQQLLPNNYYTRHRLKKLHPDELLPVFSYLSPNLFRYLPVESFYYHERFPWDLITTPQQFFNIFNTSGTNSYCKETNEEFTRQAFAQLNTATIQRIAHLLSFEHLPLFPEETLKDKNFPWGEFIQKQGAGYSLRKNLSSTLLAEAHLPWAEIAARKDIMSDLLSADKNHSIGREFDTDFTRKIFRKMAITDAILLAPALSFSHLSLFPKETLWHQDFPWKEFIQRDNAGENLRRNLTSDVLVKSHIPWYSLREGDVFVLLNTRSDFSYVGHPELNSDFTRGMLQGFDVATISNISHRLTVAHLRLCGEKLKEEHFPWLLFLQRKDIRRGLQRSFAFSSEQKFVIEAYCSEFFPWRELTLDQINELLPSDQDSLSSVSEHLPERVLLFLKNINVLCTKHYESIIALRRLDSSNEEHKI